MLPVRLHPDRGLAVPEGERTDAASVLLVAAPDGPSALADVLASCGLSARRIGHAEVAQARRRDGCGVAVVATGRDARALDAAAATVGALKREGFVVLCCATGPGSWPLGAQCRLLLAGASRLLDAGEEGFAAELGESVTRLQAAEAGRKSAELLLREQMAAHGMVGASPAIVDVFRWIQRASPLSELSVLICGETGTGKELVARALHRLDPRRARGPFVPVNCAALAAGLAESELFGHGRGAFTGADRERRGLVRAAHGGVLFLDEIGDLDAALQGKLLRVLQERRVLALGSEVETPVDVRVVAATHRDLGDLVRQGRFRADLLHRLDVLSVRLPSLRERSEDVEPLVRHFMARAVGQPEGSVSASRDFVRALQRLELRGNLRQLENVVRRALVSWRPGDTLRLSDLPPDLWLELAQLGNDAPAPPARSKRDAERDRPPLVDAVGLLEASSWRLSRALALCERSIVDAALGAASGNRSRAARLLGISPRSIFNKLRKHPPVS